MFSFLCVMCKQNQRLTLAKLFSSYPITQPNCTSFFTIVCEDCLRSCMKIMETHCPYSMAAPSWSTGSRPTARSPPGLSTPKTSCRRSRAITATLSQVRVFTKAQKLNYVHFCYFPISWKRSYISLFIFFALFPQTLAQHVVFEMPTLPGKALRKTKLCLFLVISNHC